MVWKIIEPNFENVKKSPGFWSLQREMPETLCSLTGRPPLSLHNDYLKSQIISTVFTDPYRRFHWRIYCYRFMSFFKIRRIELPNFIEMYNMPEVPAYQSIHICMLSIAICPALNGDA